VKGEVKEEMTKKMKVEVNSLGEMKYEVVKPKGKIWRILWNGDFE